MNTTVISFRVHKNLKSWLSYAGKGFESEGKLLRLIVTKAAIEQVSGAGVSRLLRDFLAKREHTKTGDTVVVAARVSMPVSRLIRECASERGKSTSEWCSLVVLDWYYYFSDLDKGHSGDAWLAEHGKQYRAYVTDMSAVYAQKMAKQRSEVKG